jgi:three-Cys-motif partner protein
VAVEYDEIGIWSEVKLAIVREYAAKYSTIREAWRREKIGRLIWMYIDAYAGPGDHFSKTTGETVEGSPLIALNTIPPFHEYHFIDTEPARAKQLRALAGERDDVKIYTEDCNTVLLRDVFPRAKHKDYRRALCLLDPYNINLSWDVIEAAGKSDSIEIFLNFMIMDINRNALRKRMEKSLKSKVDQFTRLVGDESWKDAGYREEGQTRAETDADEDEEQRRELLPVLRGAQTRRVEDREQHLQEVRSNLMSANSKIEWTDATWNPVRGCTKISPGCKNCYANASLSGSAASKDTRSSKDSISACSRQRWMTRFAGARPSGYS